MFRVKWLIYGIIAIVCLVLVKSCYENVYERFKAATSKKKRGRKKRQAELNEDGMSLSESGIQFSDNDDEADDDSDGDQSPIEMTLVNRK